jgi:hypothetical protein
MKSMRMSWEGHVAGMGKRGMHTRLFDGNVGRKETT